MLLGGIFIHMPDVFLIPNVGIWLNYICQCLIAGVESSVALKRDTINISSDVLVIIMPLVDTYMGNSSRGLKRA